MRFSDEEAKPSARAVDSADKAMLDAGRNNHEAARGESRGRSIPEFVGQGSFETTQNFRLVMPVPVNFLGSFDEDCRQTVDVREAKSLAV